MVSKNINVWTYSMINTYKITCKKIIKYLERNKMGEGIKIIEIIVYVHKQTPETIP